MSWHLGEKIKTYFEKFSHDFLVQTHLKPLDCHPKQRNRYTKFISLKTMVFAI